MPDQPSRSTPTDQEAPLRTSSGLAKAAVIVLAAGSSTRLGRPKQLLPYQGTTLLAHAAGMALASRVGPVVVVLGHDAGTMREALAGLDVETVVNRDWAEGMGASVRAGLAAVERKWPGVRAVVLMTCDQPRVPPRVLRELAESVITSTRRIAACGYGGSAGVPAAFARKFFPDLIKLSGDRGARVLLLRNMDEARVFPCPEAELDVDTEADLGALE